MMLTVVTWLIISLQELLSPPLALSQLSYKTQEVEKSAQKKKEKEKEWEENSWHLTESLWL